MKRALLLIALSTAAGGAFAGDLHCEVHSDYDLSLDDDSLRFEREGGTPGRIEIRRGRLLVDGEAMALGAADQARLERYEAQALRMAPEVREVALEAVDIAFTALAEVARGLSDDPDETLAKLHEARREVARRLDGANTAAIDDEALDAMMEETVASLVPALVGDLVKSALAAAFTGDTARAEALEARAERMEAEIERLVEPRAKALERRAEALCAQVAALDAIEEEFEFRLPGGERLDLLRSGPE